MIDAASNTETTDLTEGLADEALDREDPGFMRSTGNSCSNRPH